MIRFNYLTPPAALCALLLCFSITSSADNIQDANKLLKRGQHAQALNKIETILSSLPKDIQARFLKAVILSEQGQADEAILIFAALSKDFPELPEPYNNLAVLYAGQGRFDKAKIALEMALRTHSSYATAHENLADIYAKMASQAYDRALQLDRSNVSAKIKLALIKDLPPSAIKPAVALNPLASAASLTPPPLNPVVAKPVPIAPVSASAIASVPSSTVPALPVAVALETSSQSEEITKTLNAWTRAWSSRNVKAYLALYAQDFKTPNNETRSHWEQQRRERIGKPQAIVVTASNHKVKFHDGTHASVSFIQTYHSGALNSTTHKTLAMVKNNGQWQIQSEQTGAKK